MINKCVGLFQWMLIALGISALCLFAIPLVRERSAVQYTLAAILWAALIAEMIFQISANRIRKQIEKINPQMKQKKGFGKLGISCFAQNNEAKIVDMLLAISIMYMIAITTLPVNSVVMVISGITGIYVFFQLHCILNGILYKSIKYYQIVIHKRRERR